MGRASELWWLSLSACMRRVFTKPLSTSKDRRPARDAPLPVPVAEEDLIDLLSPPCNLSESIASVFFLPSVTVSPIYAFPFVFCSLRIRSAFRLPLYWMSYISVTPNSAIIWAWFSGSTSRFLQLRFHGIKFYLHAMHDPPRNLMDQKMIEKILKQRFGVSYHCHADSYPYILRTFTRICWISLFILSRDMRSLFSFDLSLRPRKAIWKIFIDPWL